MKILVTGGAGFIGSHIVDKMIEEGNQVTVVDDLSSGNRSNLNQSAIFYEIDITDKEKIFDLFQKEKFEIVIHAAAQKNIGCSVEDPQLDARINILGSLNLLEAARINGLKKFVYLNSGGAMYGETDQRPTPENHKIQPIFPYGISKWVVEFYLQYYQKNCQIDYLSLRLSNVYGPRQDPNGEAGVVSVFFNRIMKDEQTIINGDGEQTRDFVYVGDVADCLLECLKHHIQGIYNVATGCETSINNLLKKIAATLNKDVIGQNGPAIPDEQRTSSLDITKITKETGWQPRVNLIEGLRLTKEWFTQHEKRI